MSKMKKVMGVLMAATMTLAMSVATFAATGVTAAEQTILTEAQQKATDLGVASTAKYKNYYAQAESYLASNDLSQEQVNAMVASVDKAAATAKAQMDAKGVTKLSDLSADVLSALESDVASQVKASAAAVGITLSVAADGTVTAQNLTNGTTVATSTGVIKQTGSDMTATAVVAALVVGAIAACGFVATKKNLFSSVEA